MKSLSYFLSTGAVLMTFAGNAHAISPPPPTIIPIAATGYNSDVIYGPAFGDTTATGTFGGFNFYSTSQGFGGPSDGLPDSGTVINGSAEFQYQPYTSNNVVYQNGTLTLTTPASYSDVSFLVDAQGTQTATFTLNFSTGLPTVETAVVPNWIGGNPTPDGGSIALDNNNIYGINGQPSQFDEYDFNLSPTDAGRTLESITIATTGNVGVYALSGTEAPEPSTWAMLFSGLGIMVLVARLRKLSI